MLSNLFLSLQGTGCWAKELCAPQKGTLHSPVCVTGSPQSSHPSCPTAARALPETQTKEEKGDKGGDYRRGFKALLSRLRGGRWH